MKFNEYIKMLTESEKTSKDPTYKEMKKYLDKFKKSYEADDIDVESAIYWYASNNHTGQSSNLYSALSTSDYKPGRMESKPTGMAKEMYDLLIGEFGGEPEESSDED